MSIKFRNLLIIFITLLSLYPLIVSVMLAEFLLIDGSVVLIVLSVIIFLLGLSVGIGIDFSLYTYKCRKCGHTFKPTFKSYIFGAHTVTTRFLKCPECEGKSWCKITEEIQ